ncbi:TerD family protein [Clostridium aestuarii]|uniref:TerD family protein n=1 Tax=Clostridium aestuarii TaxID=338193 RepID=A0ABT4D1E7_9CLOT|nr:TerD family protein [Clostridium aestuarii]MCY6484932.1 TerD family protein [Clostridium aestuarii]
MQLNIDNPNRNICRSYNKRHGNLTIETSIREEKGSIDLNQPINLIQQNRNIENNNHKNLETTTSTSSAEVLSNANSTTHKQVKNKLLLNSINIDKTTNLLRGQKLSINSKTQNLSKLMIGMEWDIKFNGSSEFDLDTSIFMVDGNNNTSEENFIFYGNPISKNEGVVINKDYNTSLKKAFDKVLQLNLNVIPNNIEKLAITATIYEADIRNQNFAQVSNAYLKLIDTETKNEILRYNFNNGLKSETAVVVAEIYRYKNEWKINPIGSGFNGGLEALCNNYGIDIE